ncbi:hypothetical protein ACQP2P_15250 [Dactylosporangium sp. CA-139114]|uniref:hypothetical protein n=1 Tax=Dactylosporangium sp. CA-139114 TaxID=3239931 RepID=UPI003D966CEA
MSEYQYYEFTAVDQALTARQRSELRSLSTRADITATSFVNTYEWGDFKGDPRALMERYFDAHLYLANWGTRRLMLRLPKAVLDPATAAEYCVGDSAFAWTSGKHVIVCLNREDDDGTDEWDIDGHGLLGSILPARADLAAGNLRLLYLGWLRCVQSGELDDEPEPVVPAGLGTLSASLRAVAEFLCIDPDLLAAAADGSAATSASQPTHAQLRQWATALPAGDKDAILAALITGADGHLREQLLRRYRVEHPPHPPTAARTAGQLLSAAADRRAERERQLVARQERDRIRRERSAAAERQRRLDALAVDQESAWQQVDALIATKKPREYDTAVQLLVDLRDVAERDGDPAPFHRRLTELRATHARKPSLLDRLELAGLDG